MAVVITTMDVCTAGDVELAPVGVVAPVHDELDVCPEVALD
jgi:hypothetical protein